MNDFHSLRRESLIRYLQKHIAGEVRFDPTSRALYSTDASHYQVEPLGVVLPRSADDLLATVQIASEMDIPIISRGGGTSLSGQSIGAGLIIDCSKYLNRIGEVDVSGRRVWVEPGVVLDHLNQALAPYGLQFGPDVATANRATIGGMLGNNSAGARSVVYGKTVDHTQSLQCVMSDGRMTTFGPMTSRAWEFKEQQATREGQAYRTVREVIQQHAPEIRDRFPHIIRRVSGYNLAAYVEPECAPDVIAWRHGIVSDATSPTLSMVPLLVGSEGTLVSIASAELKLVPKPRFRGLLVPHFSSMAAALDVLALCLEARPSAVELMDAMLIDLARTQRSLRETMATIQGRPAALLMVEFQGDDAAEVSSAIHDLQRRLQGRPGLFAAVPAIDAALREPLWKLRSAAVPLLYGMPGDRKPITFVEDTAVAPERLPEFAAAFREVLLRHGTDGAFYGHASVGCLHIRPVLNLKDQADRQRMRAIMDDIVALVLQFGGSLSGEHGDGMVRSAYNQHLYGPTITKAFQTIKRAFDPNHVFNPGKVVDGPNMLDQLRPLPSAERPDPPTIFDYSKQQGFFRSIELCNGAGVCRKTQGGAMCPSYRATLDECDSTRGRANALRLALVGDADLPPPSSPLKSRWLHDVMDLCLSCKACKTECPSNVDLAKLKAEYQHAAYEGRLRPLGHYLAANVHRIQRLSSRFAGLMNWMNQRRSVRWGMEKVFGIDRRRSIPMLHADHFRRWFASHPSPVGERRKVILLDDCFTTYQEPEIGIAAVRVLEAAGFRVELAGLECCGRALLSKGFLKEARRFAQEQIPGLAARIADGTPIVGLEPSCLVALLDEWPELVPGRAAREVAASAFLIEDWLSSQWRAGGRLRLATRPVQAIYHGHCHQKAMCGTKGTTDALRYVDGLAVNALDAGCCGMAGAFGFEKEHFDISVRIANLQLLPALAEQPDARILASGTSCRHQIRDLTGRVAQHPIEIIAEALPDVLDQPSG